MKSFASLLLAAAVSANYCYSDDCNCSGETRECYSLPRQNMRPRAIPTCCPEGVMPTIYGIPNNRAAAQTASLKRGKCQKIKTSMTVTGQDGNTCFNFEGVGNILTLAPASPDMTFSVYLSGTNNRVELGNGVAAVNLDVLEVKGNMNTAQLTPESMIGKVSMKGSNVHIVGNPTYCKAGDIKGVPRTFDATQSDAACGVTSSLKGWYDEQTSVLRNQCAVAYKNRNCNNIQSASARKDCEKDASDERKDCEKNKWTSNLAVPTGRWVVVGDGSANARWVPYTSDDPRPESSKLDNFVDGRDYSVYCCQKWNRFEWECLSQGLPDANGC